MHLQEITLFDLDHVAQYPLHHATYAPVKFEVATGEDAFTVKPVLSNRTKEDQKQISKTDASLMQVNSITECSRGAFCSTFDLH